MVAGPEAAWKRVAPLLDIFGKPYFMGETPGAGQTMKLVNNLLGACAIAITTEGMAVGIKAGLDPVRMIDVLNASSGRSSATMKIGPPQAPSAGVMRRFCRISRGRRTTKTILPRFITAVVVR